MLLNDEEKNWTKRVVREFSDYTNLQDEDLEMECIVAIYKAKKSWKKDKANFKNYCFLLMRQAVMKAIIKYNGSKMENGKQMWYPRNLIKKLKFF